MIFHVRACGPAGTSLEKLQAI